MIRNAFVAAAVCAALVGAPALAAPVKLTATLTGAAETPPGKADGTGDGHAIAGQLV